MKTQLIRLASGIIIFVLFGNGMCSSSSDPTPTTTTTPTPTTNPQTSNTACQLLSATSSDGSSETYTLDSQNRLSNVTIKSSDGQTVFSLAYSKSDGNPGTIVGNKAGKEISTTSLSLTADKLTKVENTVYSVDAYSNPFGGNVSLTNLINTANLVWQGDRLTKVNGESREKGKPLLGDATTSYEYDANGNVSKLSAFNNDSFGGLIETGLAYYATFEYEDKILQPKQQAGVNLQFEFLDDGQISVQPFSAKAVRKMTTYTVDSGQATLAATSTYTNTANTQGYLIKSVSTTTYTNQPADTETITYSYNNCK